MPLNTTQPATASVPDMLELSKHSIWYGSFCSCSFCCSSFIRRVCFCSGLSFSACFNRSNLYCLQLECYPSFEIFIRVIIIHNIFFKTSKETSIDFSYCSKWTNDTVISSLVTNSYNRKAMGFKTLTIKLHANTKAVLSNEQKAAITSKGYTIA